ncbi:MAG TPA: hypothetical protein VD770_03490 [Coxiellaceae bacterium]|nr:hypothetical protein [Coxiellaceae bacterium]
MKLTIRGVKEKIPLKEIPLLKLFPWQITKVTNEIAKQLPTSVYMGPPLGGGAEAATEVADVAWLKALVEKFPQLKERVTAHLVGQRGYLRELIKFNPTGPVPVAAHMLWNTRTLVDCFPTLAESIANLFSTEGSRVESASDSRRTAHAAHFFPRIAEARAAAGAGAAVAVESDESEVEVEPPPAKRPRGGSE